MSAVNLCVAAHLVKLKVFICPLLWEICRTGNSCRCHPPKNELLSPWLLKRSAAHIPLWLTLVILEKLTLFLIWVHYSPCWSVVEHRYIQWVTPPNHFRNCKIRFHRNLLRPILILVSCNELVRILSGHCFRCSFHTNIVPLVIHGGTWK